MGWTDVMYAGLLVRRPQNVDASSGMAIYRHQDLSVMVQMDERPTSPILVSGPCLVMPSNIVLTISSSPRRLLLLHRQSRVFAPQPPSSLCHPTLFARLSRSILSPRLCVRCQPRALPP